jgi:hypothetical protein
VSFTVANMRRVGKMVARRKAFPPVLPSVPKGSVKQRMSVRFVAVEVSSVQDGFRQVRKDRHRLANRLHSHAVPVVNQLQLKECT